MSRAQEQRRSWLRRPLLPLLCTWLVCVIAACFGLLWSERSGEGELKDRFAVRAEVTSDLVSAYVNEVFGREERLAADLMSGDVPMEQFGTAAGLLGFEAALLLDDRGRVAATAPESPALLGTDLASDFPHLGSALSGQRAVSDAIRSAVRGDPIVAFALPVRGTDVAVISGGFRLSQSPLQTLLDKHPVVGSRGHLIDSTGTPIAGSDDLRHDAGVIDAARSEPVARDGRVVTAAPVAGTAWTYVLDAPETALYAPTARDDLFWWSGIAVLAAGSLAALVYGARIHASRRRGSELQRQADRRLALTMLHAPIGMTILDLEHRILDPNPRLCAMLGYTGDELREMTLDGVTHPEDHGRDDSQVVRLARGEIDSYECPKRYLRRDGTQFWGLLALSVVRDEDGLPRHHVAQVQDVTDTVERMAELERFAGVVAHDLKNPVSAVAMWTEHLEDELREHLDSAGERYLVPTRRITAAATRMTQLIDDLLAFTASNATSHLERTEVDLDACADEVLGALSTGLSDEEPVLELRALGTVQANPALMRQLLGNLVTNGLKYVATGVRPHVVIDTRRVGGVLELTVTDNGIGIARDQRDRIFEPFYRVEQAEQYAGTGLGLAICHRTMQVHGGSIRAEAGPGGRGTTFACTFPAAPAVSEPRLVTPAAVPGRAGG